MQYKKKKSEIINTGTLFFLWSQSVQHDLCYKIRVVRSLYVGCRCVHVHPKKHFTGRDCLYILRVMSSRIRGFLSGCFFFIINYIKFIG